MKNILKYINLLLVVLLLASCDDYLDVNTDPNNPTEVTPDLLLPVAQKYTGEIISGSDEGGRRYQTVANLFMYNWSQADGYNWFPDEFKYLVTTSFYDRIFEQSYYDALKEYQVLVELEDPNYDYYRAIGMIMKAYHFQLLVDTYGDVPYFEALLRGGDATPAYDDAATIYADLMVQLTAAIDVINNVDEATVMEVGTDDAMFGGDMTSWKQFANSVKLRILTRLSSMASPPVNISTEFAAIATEGSGFITADASINPGYVAEEGKQNPFWNLYGYDPAGSAEMSNNATCATQYILDYLMATGDDRIDYIYEEPATGHLGVVQGLLGYPPETYTFDLVSNLGPGILKGADQDVVIYTLAECYLNLAEAALNGYVSGSARTYYESGVQASFDYLGAGDATAYLTSGLNNVSWTASSNELQAIITQKWIATNSITAEQAWFEYNRTGYPDPAAFGDYGAGLPISQLASTPDRPVRLYYPASEISSNGENVPSQPDAFTAKIFWAN
ncbi:MAG: SusD/RagB family nutrient-binding outer membrane lipoprotein [Bacteroidetes bacterium]|nr:SusD/RagB family nutrient-binding outer membrane lipoprotein [Bacteroidota bacterium]